MTYSPIPKGTPNWDVPLNAALSVLDNTIAANNSNALQAANNLSDLTSASQARLNLGISSGSAAGVSQFNVKDYGAIGNGVADDRVPIQNAMAAATSAGGAVVFFPHGTYLVNSGTGFSTSSSGVTLRGEGSNATQISIGASYTGTSLFTWTGNYGGLQDLSIIGASTTTTSNPASHGVTVSGGQTFRVVNATFLNINGYAIRANGTAATTLHGGTLDNVKIQSCAGGISIVSDSTNTAANFMMTNIFTRFLGVNSGTNANLDGIHIEDSWDVLCQNVFAWMNATTGGTGAAFRVKGNCAATFVQNLDALGPQTGTNVVIESGPNGDPQNVQIAGGVIQQGSVGLAITGSSNQVRVRNMRILNNQTHNIVVSTNGSGSTGGIYFDECAISQGGAGATGTNYDINWTGTAEGFITDCRFGSPIVSIGTAGVQGVVNITSAVVRADNVNFAGTGTAGTNIFPGIFPQYLLRADLTNAEWRGNLDYRLTGTNRVSFRADTATSNAIAFNVAGAAGTDNFRILGDGSMQWGSGSAARDVNMGRSAAGIWYTDKNALVGSATALGDNGVGEIQLANATTVPTTNPTGGVTLYAESGSAAAIKIRDTAGQIRGLVDGFAISAANQTTTSTSQVASTSLVIPVQANATYIMDASLLFNQTNAITFSHSWTGPASATMVWGDIQTKTKIATITGTDTWTGSGTDQLIALKGVLVTAGTAGNLTVTFATGNGANTVTLLAQSFVRLTRVK